MAVNPSIQYRQPAQQNNDASLQYYTASLSPYLQGTEIVRFFQLLNYTNLKIRSNTSPVISLNGSSQGWQAIGENFQSFDDNLSPQNFGSLSTSRSQASIAVENRLDTYISHYAEQRDLGQSNVYDDGNPFEECSIIENSPPTFLLENHPESFVLPVSLVQAGFSVSSFDGVIEVQDIRRVADRSSIDLPFVIKGPKGSLSVTDDNMKSYQISDEFDLRQISQGFSAAPYLDSVGYFGSGSLIDQPGAFSDSPENLSSFKDSAKIEGAYPNDSIDSTFRSLILSGTVSGSVQVKAPDTNWFPTYLVAARHGFVFSQNDNYVYDSIAFRGMKK